MVVQEEVEEQAIPGLNIVMAKLITTQKVAAQVGAVDQAVHLAMMEEMELEELMALFRSELIKTLIL